MYNSEKPYKNQLLALIEKTWQTPYLAVQPGTYALFRRKFNYLEVDHTDGLGTKGVYHWQKHSFRSAVLDALAMNLNDLAMVRARPYKLQCHLILPQDDKRAILTIMKNLVKECQQRQIAITGGETSIQNNIQGLDISLTVSGFVKKKKNNQFQRGDVLVGLASNGLHANGFTLVRQVLDAKFFPALVKPTKIYLEELLKLDKQYNIHGSMHITGGAYTRLKSLLGKNDAIIGQEHQLKLPLIFKKLYDCHISDEIMYKTFNCGFGFIAAVSRKDAEKIVKQMSSAHIIGKVTAGTGKVKITSMFSGQEIEV